MGNRELLVSICVSTYNSSKTILETLDSIYSQTYSNLQLIVSDDGSKDDTVCIVKEWMSAKKMRFINPQILTVTNNTGTSANSNRAFRAADGVWIKGIAGDDVLFPDAIEKCIRYVADKPMIKWLFAKAVFYKNRISKDCIIEDKSEKFQIYNDLNSLDARKQLEKNYLGNYFKCPTHFLRKDLVDSVGGFDEDFGILEDYPMWLRILQYGEKCYYMDEFIMGYRISDTNVSVFNNSFVNRKMLDLTFNAQKKYILCHCPKHYRYNIVLTYWIRRLFSSCFFNKNRKLDVLFYRFCLRSVNFFTLELIH